MNQNGNMQTNVSRPPAYSSRDSGPSIVNPTLRVPHHNYRTTRRPTHPSISHVLRQMCDWGRCKLHPRQCCLPSAPARDGSYGWDVRGTIPQTTASVGSAATGDCRCLFFFIRSSNSGLGSTRRPHTVRALRHGCGPVQNASRRGCVHGMAQHAHFVHGGSLGTGEVLPERWNWTAPSGWTKMCTLCSR